MPVISGRRVSNGQATTVFSTASQAAGKLSSGSASRQVLENELAGFLAAILWIRSTFILSG
jgi:hypothetical protein